MFLLRVWVNQSQHINIREPVQASNMITQSIVTQKDGSDTSWTGKAGPANTTLYPIHIHMHTTTGWRLCRQNSVKLHQNVTVGYLRAMKHERSFQFFVHSCISFLFVSLLFLNKIITVLKINFLHLQITQFGADCCTCLTNDPSSWLSTLLVEYSRTPPCHPTITPALPSSAWGTGLDVRVRLQRRPGKKCL